MRNTTIKQVLSSIALFGAFATANAADVNTVLGRAAPATGTVAQNIQVTGTPVTEVQGRAGHTIPSKATAAGPVRADRAAAVANRLGRA
ncbi:MAG: hypothetical protein ACKVQA_09140 [Burkholderiales bacterium]